MKNSKNDFPNAPTTSSLVLETNRSIRILEETLSDLETFLSILATKTKSK